MCSVAAHYAGCTGVCVLTCYYLCGARSAQLCRECYVVEGGGTIYRSAKRATI